ncbi:MAG: thiamine pyrophosphate-dependent dehydrogenase E1 component subunit alpha [Dehalococcoidia bacterium]
MAELPPKERLTWMYERMALSRALEEALIQASLAGDSTRIGHPYMGQEAVAVGACAALASTDYVVSYHRSHGHAVAKGVDPKRFMAELYGKGTGVCRGKAGEMWMADHGVGFMGCTEVVGGNIPLAAGLALASKTLKNRRVTVSFFGDGATNQGTFHESLNLAAVWKLPIVFVCENNLYAESTPVEYAIATGDIAPRAAAYAMPAAAVDGQDAVAVYGAVGEAAARARAGDGPTLVEAKTYRYHGHYYGDRHLRYRTEAEVEYYRSRDCIDGLRALLLERSLATDAELTAVDERVRSTAEEAIAFARESPPPPQEELYSDLYIG